jgi:hypothetical protein
VRLPISPSSRGVVVADTAPKAKGDLKSMVALLACRLFNFNPTFYWKFFPNAAFFAT